MSAAYDGARRVPLTALFAAHLDDRAMPRIGCL